MESLCMVVIHVLRNHESEMALAEEDKVPKTLVLDGYASSADDAVLFLGTVFAGSAGSVPAGNGPDFDVALTSLLIGFAGMTAGGLANYVLGKRYEPTPRQVTVTTIGGAAGLLIGLYGYVGISEDEAGVPLSAGRRDLASEQESRYARCLPRAGPSTESAQDSNDGISTSSACTFDWF
jgi:hypothetical protein